MWEHKMWWVQVKRTNSIHCRRELLPCYFISPYSLPSGSAGKESVWSSGDQGLIPGLGRFPGEGKQQPTPVFFPGKSYGQRSLVSYSPWGHRYDWVTNTYLLTKEISRVSLVAQWLRIRLPMQETQVQPIGREDPLEKEMANHSNILAWEIPWTEEPNGLLSIGSQRGQTQLSN